jgi:peptide/nickel transport system substrate-binding protein
MNRRSFHSTCAALAALGASVALTACGSGADGGTTTAAAGTGSTAASLTIARSADAVTLDPRLANENESIWTSQLLYSTLVVSAPDGKSVRPALASKYVSSADGLTWTFTLRPGVTFSDGAPVTAADVVFSLGLNRKATAPWSFSLAAVKSVKAKGDDTVVIGLKHPYAPLLANLALFANAVVPADFGGRSAKDFYAKPIGSGPYTLSRWDHGSTLKLTANPRWWGPKLSARTLTFTNVSNDNSRVLQLKGGQADVIETPPLSQLAAISASPGLRATAYPSTYSRFLAMNQKREPFGDIHVRKAIWHALDRAAITKAVLFGKGEVATSFFSEAMPFHAAHTPTLAFDLAAAKAELARSSVPNGFSTTMVVGAGDTTENALGQAIQAALAEIGIKVTLKPVDVTDEFANYLGKGNFDLGLNYYTSDIPDPDEIVSFMVSGGFLVGYENPRVTKLASAAAQELDESKRGDMYAEMQRIVAQDAVWIPLYYAPYAYGAGKEAAGFGISTLGSYLLPGTTPEAP